MRSGSPTYQQVWLRGDPEGPTAHVHEGVQLADKSGWVAIGELLPGENQTPEVFKVRERQYWRKLRFPEQAIIRAVDNEAATKWTQIIGEANQDPANSSYTVTDNVVTNAGPRPGNVEVTNRTGATCLGVEYLS